MLLDDLTYGALTQEQAKHLEEDTPFFTCRKEDLPLVTPPANSSRKTAYEMRFLQHVMSEQPLDPFFVQQADRNMLSLYEEHLQAYGLPMPEWLEPLLQQAGVFITHLKAHYNRPRPYQIAPYVLPDFRPHKTLTGHSPAYPSGHACQAFLAARVLHARYKHKGFKDLAKAISLSRLQLGVHYPSDKKYGEFLGHWLYEHLQDHFK